MKFYIKPTQEHPNEKGEYALIQEGTLCLFTGQSYEETANEEKFKIAFNKLSSKQKEQDFIECEIDDKFKFKSLKIELQDTDNYEVNPINEADKQKGIIKPCLFEKAPCPLRFKRKKTGILIGLIKAYKQDKNKEFIDDISSLNNPHNEIYTVDIEQEIQLRAFVYEGQRIYVAKDTSEIYADNEKPTDIPAQQGNITKDIYFSMQNDDNIRWAFKIVDGSYKNGREEAFPPIENFIKYNENLNIGFNGTSNEYKDIKQIPILTIRNSCIELPYKGAIQTLKLSDLFIDELLESLINKNIIFFAYDANVGIITLTQKNDSGIKYEVIKGQTKKVGIYNAYAKYAMKNYKNWVNRQITIDRISSVELKIIKTRFRLECDGQTLQFLENERIIKEWLCKKNDKKMIENKCHIKLNALFESLKDKGIILESNSKKELFDLLEKAYPNLKYKDSEYSIELNIKYQKRILILIERFKQTTESTLARMNIFIDGKRVDSKGNFIEKLTAQGTKEYEIFNPFSLPNDKNNYAYILERPGPDSIAGEVNLRIPEGRYGAMWNDGNMKGVLKLFNNYLSKGRTILIHGGNTPKNSKGCLLINDKKGSDDTIIKIENEKKIIRFKQNLEHWLKKINNNTIDESVTIIIKNHFVINDINEVANKTDKNKLYSIEDARESLKIIYERHGKEMARIIEKMYRNETNHFKSKQYKNTGTGGMEASGKPPYYGWDKNFFEQNPLYKPLGIWAAFENKGLSGQGGNLQIKNKKKKFIIMPSVLAGMDYKAYYINKYNGNWARWHSTQTQAQEIYKKAINSIKARIVDEIIKNNKS